MMACQNCGFQTGRLVQVVFDRCKFLQSNSQAVAPRGWQIKLFFVNGVVQHPFALIAVKNQLVAALAVDHELDDRVGLLNSEAVPGPEPSLVFGQQGRLVLRHLSPGVWEPSSFRFGLSRVLGQVCEKAQHLNVKMSV